LILCILHLTIGKSIFLLVEMGLERIHILPTDKTPEVILDPDGIIKIKGRYLVLNNTEVPEQIKSWIEDYLLNPSESTVVIISLEYLNSFGTKILTSTLREISKVILYNKKFTIQWYYDDDDEDILERGEYISETLNMPIKFIKIDSIGDS